MKVCAFMGLEGVVMKRRGGCTRPGFRSPDWIKVPIRHREEFSSLATCRAHVDSAR